MAGKYLKPYQGLKQRLNLPVVTFDPAGKYLKPYQGLKRDKQKQTKRGSMPENT